MDRLLARLERRFGRYAIHGLTWYLVGAQAIAFVLILTNPQFMHWLVLDRDLVLRGQVWRLVTYLFIPPSLSPIWVLFGLYWLYLMGTTLEREWGAFKYQAFWVIGMILTTAIAFGFNVRATNLELTESLFLAFATLFPDFEMLLFFIVPVKMKWLGLVAGIVVLAQIGMYSGLEKLIPVIAVGNYLLFFTPTLLDLARNTARRTRHRADSRSRFAVARPPPPEARRCTLCGVTNEDPDIEFRVCTCAKCGKPTDFCLAHARNH